MSVRQTILRYIHVLNKLRKAPATFHEIDQYLELQSHLQEERFTVSKRQFQRDLKDISSIFELDISYDVRQGVYRIEEELSPISKRRLEAFDTFNALRIGENTSDYLHFENRKPLGTENLYGLIHAIKNRLMIRFTYQKFWEDEATLRRVEPYALKEFRSRWYVLANDQKDGKVKSFALDRLSGLEITGNHFHLPGDYSVEESYRHCFGIIGSQGKEPQEIILSMDPVQGKYVKTLPLHDSQQILMDNDQELRLRLNLCVTYDLVKELLSYGEYLKVLQPAALADEIRQIHQKAAKQSPGKRITVIK